MTLTTRTARPDELAAAGRVTVEAYRAAGFIDDDTGYADELADAVRRAEATDLLVAVRPDGAVVGTATLILAPDSAYAELAGEGDAELRMLAVAPSSQGGGVGRALVAECLRRARAAGCRRFVLSSRPDMTTAHRLYRRLGFARAPHLDWEPVPGLRLWGFTLELAPDKGPT